MTTPASRETFDAFEAQGWEQAATAYERFFGRVTDRLIEPILDSSGVGHGTRILDVACGPGNLTARAAARGAYPVGVDVADAMLARARANHPGIDFRRGDAHSLPFPASTFDVVVASFAILHLSEPERAAAEMARVLVPGGKIALTVWDAPERARLFGWVNEALALAGVGPPSDIPAGPPFFRFADEQELRALLDGGGFEKPIVEDITFTHSAVSTEAIWTAITTGTVRTAALIRNQQLVTQHAIRAAFDQVIPHAASDAEVTIPFAVKLATASTLPAL